MFKYSPYPPHTYLRTSGTGSGLVSRNKEGTQVVLAQFPASGDFSSFGLTPSLIKSIAIPNNIQEWPTSALSGCTALERITTFGEPAKEAVIELSRDHGFKQLTGLKFIRFPSTLKSTVEGNYSTDASGSVFSKNLQSVDFRNCSSLQTIGSVAFDGCSGLISVDLSGCSSLTSISLYSISNCSNLTSLDFSGCSALQSIGNRSVCWCTSLTSLNLAGCSSLRSIGTEAFYGCGNLVFLNLSDCSSLQSIENWAFYICSQLQTAIFPASLTSIVDACFCGADALKVYWMGPSQAANIGIDAFPSSVTHVYNYKP